MGAQTTTACIRDTADVLCVGQERAEALSWRAECALPECSFNSSLVRVPKVCMRKDHEQGARWRLCKVSHLKPEKNSQELDKGMSAGYFSLSFQREACQGHEAICSSDQFWLIEIKGEFIGRIPGAPNADVESEACRQSGKDTADPEGREVVRQGANAKRMNTGPSSLCSRFQRQDRAPRSLALVQVPSLCPGPLCWLVVLST